jgi:hypothetical protein
LTVVDATDPAGLSVTSAPLIARAGPHQASDIFDQGGDVGGFGRFDPSTTSGSMEPNPTPPALLDGPDWLTAAAAAGAGRAPTGFKEKATLTVERAPPNGASGSKV